WAALGVIIASSALGVVLMFCSVGALIRVLEGTDAGQEAHVSAMPQLIVRASTAPPKQGV
ncbi:hypothetical protein, partial [Inquilinus sp.]|uniref:hypothetical protein n=1 Tax=Inquilinus sp. TaxID=1932117 RepID=UPI0031E37032